VTATVAVPDAGTVDFQITQSEPPR
jgi:hypothetical protein